MKIEFRDVKKLSDVVSNYCVRQCRPGRICTATSSHLLYIDHKKHPNEAKGIDCSKSPPEPAIGANATHIQHDIVWNMFCVHDENQKLLITTAGFDGVTAYNTENDEMVWGLKGNLPRMKEQIMAEGVAADGNGRLFVSDESNRCIHIVTVEGLYAGVLLKEGEQKLGRPRLIHWCSETSSLIVAHIIDEQYCISKIEVTEASGTLHTQATGNNQDDDSSGQREEKEENEETFRRSCRKPGTNDKNTARDSKTLPGDPGCGQTNTETNTVNDIEALQEEVGKHPIVSVEQAKDVVGAEADEQSTIDEDVDLFLEALTQNINALRKKSTNATGKGISRTHMDLTSTEDMDRKAAEHLQDEDVVDAYVQLEDIQEAATLKAKPVDTSQAKAGDLLVLDSPQTEKTEKTSKRKGIYLFSVLVSNTVYMVSENCKTY